MLGHTALDTSVETPHDANIVRKLAMSNPVFLRAIEGPKRRPNPFIMYDMRDVCTPAGNHLPGRGNHLLMIARGQP